MFVAVAEEAIAAMQRAFDNGRARTSFRDYIFDINKYLILFFGRLPATSIRYETIEHFAGWHESAMGNGSCTEDQHHAYHASAYNRVVNLARRHGLIPAERAFPGPPIDAEHTQARPAFS